MSVNLTTQQIGARNFEAFVAFAEKAQSDNTLAQFKDKVVSVNTKDRIRGFFTPLASGRDTKLNDTTRKQFLDSVLKMFGAKKAEELPADLQKALKLQDFGKGKPLSARRIKAVLTAVSQTAEYRKSRFTGGVIDHINTNLTDSIRVPKDQYLVRLTTGLDKLLLAKNEGGVGLKELLGQMFRTPEAAEKAQTMMSGFVQSLKEALSSPGIPAGIWLNLGKDSCMIPINESKTFSAALKEALEGLKAAFDQLPLAEESTSREDLSKILTLLTDKAIDTIDRRQGYERRTLIAQTLHDIATADLEKILAQYPKSGLQVKNLVHYIDNMYTARGQKDPTFEARMMSTPSLKEMREVLSDFYREVAPDCLNRAVHRCLVHECLSSARQELREAAGLDLPADKLEMAELSDSLTFVDEVKDGQPFDPQACREKMQKKAAGFVALEKAKFEAVDRHPELSLDQKKMIKEKAMDCKALTPVKIDAVISSVAGFRDRFRETLKACLEGSANLFETLGQLARDYGKALEEAVTKTDDGENDGICKGKMNTIALETVCDDPEIKSLLQTKGKDGKFVPAGELQKLKERLDDERLVAEGQISAANGFVETSVRYGIAARTSMLVDMLLSLSAR